MPEEGSFTCEVHGLINPPPKIKPPRFHLPDEVLRAVFEEYLRLDLPVHILLGVSQQWRKVVMENQLLWRRLSLSADPVPGSFRAWSLDSGYLRSLIPNHSQDISALEIASFMVPEDGTFNPGRVCSCKTVGKLALHRISFLCIIVNPEMTRDLVSESLSGAFSGGLPCFESVMIASAAELEDPSTPLNALVNMVGESSVRLKSLYLENVNKDLVTHASTKAFWKRLIRITIRNSFRSLDAKLFAQSPNLEFLSFDGELVASPVPAAIGIDSSTNNSIQFPELKWLRVSLLSIRSLACFNVPKLHTMAIDCLREDRPAPAPAPGKLLIPALKVLQIMAVNPTLACINAPELDTLCLSIPALKRADADDVLKSVFHGGEGMMKPKHLNLRAPVHDKHLVDALRVLGEKLISLELDNQMPLGKVFWREMTPRASCWGPEAFTGGNANERGNVSAGTTSEGAFARNFKPLLLPNLWCLMVDVHKNPMALGEGREMRALLKKLIDGRRASDSHESLHRLACTWHAANSMEEMIDPPACFHCRSKEPLSA